MQVDTFMRVISAHYVGFTDFSIFLHYFIYLFICVISSSIFADLLATMNICISNLRTLNLAHFHHLKNHLILGHILNLINKWFQCK